MPQKPLSIKQAIFNRRMLICMATGFASGLPLYILIQLVPAWLRDQGIGLKEIGLFSLITFPYTWKFIWSPLMDRYSLPFLGLRRGWILITQVAVMLCVGALGLFNPTEGLQPIVFLVGAVAFFSASQDIVIDAYRRELLPDNELGLGTSIHANAYRVAGLIPGSLSLILADILPWKSVFFITALFMLVGIIMTLMIAELEHKHQPATLTDAVVKPFIEFFTRDGVRQALWILSFMFLYKLGDNLATALSTPFYLDLGFTKTQIGLVAKNAALWPAVIGGLIGGILMLRIGINRALWLFGAVQILSILGFVILAKAGAVVWVLAAVISVEYLGAGLGTAAFLAFIAKNASKSHTATQLALLTAVTAIPRTFANATTGYIVEAVGWEDFFYICTLCAIPGMLVLFKVAPWNKPVKQ